MKEFTLVIDDDGKHYQDYKLSLLGDIFSRKRGVWKKLRPSVDRDGYKMVAMYDNGKQVVRRIHRLMLCSWLGNCPSGMECRHLDGNPSNNSLSNLCWGTRKENSADRILHGTDNRGSKHGQAKLTEENVAEIREIYADAKISQRELAERYGVTIVMIGKIVRGKKWKHVGGLLTHRGCSFNGRKLTADQVRDIRLLYSSGDTTYQELADQFGVVRATISLIVRRKTWTHI